jgi:hypothetical protein
MIKKLFKPEEILQIKENLKIMSSSSLF